MTLRVSGRSPSPPPARAVFVEYVTDIEVMVKADIFIGTYSTANGPRPPPTNHVRTRVCVCVCACACCVREYSGWSK